VNSTFLVNDALRKVWCNPFQDTQFIVEPARITPSDGEIGTFTYVWDTIPLPTQADTYHVFQIGQLDPQYLNMVDEQNVWVSFTEIMRNNNLVANFYNQEGWLAPRFECWLLQYTDQCLMIAVRDQKPLADFGNDALFMRIYSNAWYKTDAGRQAVAGVYTAGVRVTSTTGAVALQNTATTYQNLGPGFQWIHNGYLVDAVPPSRISVGDTVEFVYDASVFQVLNIPVASLLQFQSTKDSCFKYLLHNNVGPRPTIDYQDDIDIYVVNPGTNNTYQAVYYHKNNPVAMRQLTQQDYSIPVDYLDAYANNQNWLSSNLTVRLYIRGGGYGNRPLVFENNRIFELYKLPDAEIVQAMIGTASNVPNWQAAVLEASPYVTVMGEIAEDVTQDQVQAAYGYNAISKLTGNTPLLIQNLPQGPGVWLPPALQTDSTVYEYDTNRLLLGIYNHVVGNIYYPVNSNCFMIEAIVGMGGIETGIAVYQAPTTITLNPNVGQRVYLCSNINGTPSSFWEDITGNTTYYTVSSNGTVGTFVIDNTDHFVAVAGDDKFLTYQFSTQSVDGTQIFAVQGNVTSSTLGGSGMVTADTLQDVPLVPGQVDIWMNGHSLVLGVDYYMSWPTISVCNMSYLDPSGIQNFTVRCMGFAVGINAIEGPDEIGFVSYNMLSRNGIFNIRDDRVMRIIAAGKIFQQDELVYSEGDGTVSLPVSVPNGSPYSIEEIVVPLRQLVDTDTYTMRAASQAIDATISAYLSLKLPDAPESEPDQITSLYNVYSVFFTKVLSDVKAGAISMANFQGLYPDTDVYNYLQSYEDILKLDPIWHGVDNFHINVIPHPWPNAVTVSAYQYKFLLAVNRAFLGGQLDLSSFLQMSANGL
jgi:hypothetical protein